MVCRLASGEAGEGIVASRAGVGRVEEGLVEPRGGTRSWQRPELDRGLRWMRPRSGHAGVWAEARRQLSFSRGKGPAPVTDAARYWELKIPRFVIT